MASRSPGSRGLPLLPVAGDSGSKALASAQRFGPFVEGHTLVIASTADFHVRAGDSSVVADTTCSRFPAGSYQFEVPAGCTHVSMIDTTQAAGNGQAYEG